MKTGRCPKCGGTDIRWQEGGWNQRNYLPLGSFGGRVAAITNYVCVSCGYLESYVRPNDLEAVARRWKRLNPEKSSTPSLLE